MHATDPHFARALAQARPTMTCIHLVHDVCRGQPPLGAVWNRWTGLLDWNTGMA